MKKWICWLMIVIMIMALAPVPKASAADDGTLILPEYTVTVGEEAYAGDTGITTLVIPKNVQTIGPRAFAGCTSLTDVYIGKSSTMEIAKDAFAECGELHFYVFAETKGELFALSHGFNFDRLDQGSSFLEKAMDIVANNGGSSILQSSSFAAKRLIVCRKNNKLPDISELEPTEIAYKDDIFIVQFDTVDNTANCYTLLANDANTVFVEADECISVLDDVSGAGVVNSSVWDTDDPMGFDVYSPFVAENGSGVITIAVVDSGIRKLSSYASKLREDGINMLYPQDQASWEQDDQRHGSVIASIISDCVGNANVSILPIRVVGSAGNSNPSMIGNGILYAQEHGAKIIVLSANFKKNDYVTHCIDEVSALGVRVIVAAGNDSRNITKVYPANLPNVITVSGIDNTYTLSATSNYGAGVDYCAPDSGIKTSAYSYVDVGTSFSVPMIAAALALVQLDPYHTVADMDASCYLSNDTGSPQNSYGKGMPRLDRLAKIKVDYLTIGNCPAQMNVGQTADLSWTIVPDNATDKTVTVTSSNESVLSVVYEGSAVRAKAKAAGTATLTFTPNGSGSPVSREIRVVQPVESITITGAPAKLLVNKTVQLTAVVSPNNATEKGVIWQSLDNCAEVDANGVVTGRADGTAKIRATAKDGSGKFAEVQFPVQTAPDAEGIVLYGNDQNVTNGTIQMVPGQVITMKATVLPAGAEQVVTFTAGGGNIISMTQSGVNAAITANQPGTAMIMVSNPTVSQAVTLTIKVAVMPVSVAVAGTSTIDEGATTTLTCTVLPDSTTDKSVSWVSSNPNVATVNSNGVVTGISAGTATITAISNAKNTVTGSITITVRHKYMLSFNLNKPSMPAGCDGTPTLNGANSIQKYSGAAVGALPTAQLDYCDFLGWRDASGNQITETSVINTTASSVTLYAAWSIHAESGWVLTSSVPTNATITQTSYSYREETKSTESTLSGWTTNGSEWRQTDTGSSYYASFPSGYDTSNKYYKNYMKSAYTASETETTKRTVSNAQEGWIYWHWGYNVKYASGTTRPISSKKGTYGSGNFYYGYFYAMASNTDCPYLSKDYCNNQNVASYNAKSVVNAMASSADKTNTTSGLVTDRFFRFNRYKSTYVDYVKDYKYYRDFSYQSEYPTGSDTITISNIITYVKYRQK